MALGERIKELRELNDLTQAQLATKAGVSPAYVSRLEAGQCYNISIKVLVQIARSLNTTPDDLLYSAGYFERPSHEQLPDLTTYIRLTTKLDAQTIKEIEDFIAFKTAGGAAAVRRGD